jgi:hypothetical protein
MSSPTWIQLWVERLTMDPAAWTAAHTLQLLLGRDAPQRVARADLWELSVEGAEAPIAPRFEAWSKGSNLFVNPSRDKGVLLDGAPPEDGPSVARVVAVDRGANESRAHAITLGHALGGRWRVRRGVVWTLAWPAERAAEVPALVDRAAWARRRRSGLLVNAEAQEARIVHQRWSNPILPAAQPATSGGA